MIYKTFAIALVLIANACTPSETETTQIIEADLTAQTRAPQEEENSHVYLEELHYMHLMTEFGEDHPLISAYQNSFDETFAGGKPGAGCPTPRPCDGQILNCKAFAYEMLDRMKSFTQMEEVQINIYNNSGQLMNEIAGIEEARCPKPRTHDFFLAEPLQGNGYFEISFVSEFTEGEIVGFKVPFEQQ